MYTLSDFNQLPNEKAEAELFKCCGSKTWANLLMKHFPFENEKMLFDAAKEIWYKQCLEADYLEAFGHHPKIGGVKSLQKKFAATSDWAGKEQAGAQSADLGIIEELAEKNETYFQKYGYIFIVCATGKSAAEMLRLMHERLGHGLEEELNIAAGEQHKITLIRLKKLLQFKEDFWNKVSQVTTHVLDTSIGSPGKGICIRLKKMINGQWQTLSLGITNEDGRISDLLPAGVELPKGHFQMCFDTGSYFRDTDRVGFYPKVDIDFMTFDQSHYHVPLLINPFGYSTYRGS